MSLTQTQSALISVAASARETLSGDGRSLGEIISFSNSRSLADANIDGWYQATGTIQRSGSIQYNHISLGNTSPLSANSSPNNLGTGAFKQGFTSNGTYASLVYFELLTNNTGLGAGANANLGCPLNLYTYAASPPGAFLTSMTNPGDCWLAYFSNTATAVASATPDYDLTIGTAPSGGGTTATITFKIVVFFRTAQFPT